MRDLLNMVNGNLFAKYKKGFKDKLTIKPDENVVECVEENLKTEYRLYDEGMFSDAPGYLMEISNTLQDDDIPAVLLNRLSVIFRDVSNTASREGNAKAGELLVKRFGLGKTGGFELQMEAALIARDKNIAKRFNTGKNAPGDIKKETRACNDGFLEKQIDSTGETIIWMLRKYSSPESKRTILNDVVECLSSQYRRRLFERDEIVSHVDSACDKLIEYGFIQSNTRNDVLTLKR